jgi:hypothetical protein
MASISVINLVNSLALAANLTGDAKALSIFQKNFIGVIHCANVNAATTVAAKIEHSDDGVNWFDAVSFTNIVGASANHEQKQVTINLLQYVRANITLSGTTKLADVKINLCHDK